MKETLSSYVSLKLEVCSIDVEATIVKKDLNATSTAKKRIKFKWKQFLLLLFFMICERVYNI